MWLITKLYHNKILSCMLHTLVYELKKNLKDCETVLDLWCGPSSPLQYCKNIKHSVWVEAFQPYLERSVEKKIHTEYIQKKLQELEFPDNSFDAVIMIEVIEHLPEELWINIMKKIKKWAKKRVIISSPNGFIPQESIDNNPLQKHLSGWDKQKMEKLWFKCNWLAWLKILRKEVEWNTMWDDLTVSIRFKPKIFWFIISVLSQLFVYYMPSLAFELISVYNINDKEGN